MGRWEDLSGQTFGKLTVLRFDAIRNKKTCWVCKCVCGKVVSIRSDAIKRGSIACDCERSTGPKESLAGMRFGRLVVKKQAGFKARPRSRVYLWKCRCDCGKTAIVRGSALNAGKTKSCGCLQKEQAAQRAKLMGKVNKKHGKTRTREYETWHHMRQRCYDKNTPSYKYYGAKGVRICQRWASFANFLADMGPRPAGKYTIDRINPNGNYEPGNCRWATQTTQQRNRRKHRWLTYNGETKCLSEWAEKFQMPMVLLWQRLNSGWSLEKALNTPPVPLKDSWRRRSQKDLRS